MKEIKISDISQNRTEIMGFATLMIVFFHMRLPIKNEIFLSIKNLFDCGVDIFLFLSGWGCVYSLNRTPNRVTYVKRRFFRIVPEYIIVFTTWYFYIALQYESLKNGVVSFVVSISTLNFWLWNDLTIWYVPAILVLYIFSMILYRYKNKLLWILLGSLLFAVLGIILEFSNILIFVERIPIYIMGFYVGESIINNRKISKIRLNNFILALILIFFACLFIAYGVNWKRISYLIYFLLTPIMCILLIYVNNKFNQKLLRSFNFFGKLSYEIYLVFECVLRCIEIALNITLSNLHLTMSLLLNIGSFCVTLIIAVGLRYINKQIITICLEKKQM